MADYDERGWMEIGAVLRSARGRQGLDIRTVEERTKIRTKYLRALEGEDWDVLPNPAYAKGFLRTYARLLGLDADALVDEYRRQVESDRPPAGRLGGEQVLETRRRLSEPVRRGRPGPIVAVGAAVTIVFLLVLGLTAGDDDEGDRERAERREQREQRQEERGSAADERRAGRAGQGPVRLRLVLESDLRVCLIGDAARPLIAGQVLAAGTEERFEARRFRLGFPSGYDPDQLRLLIDGEHVSLPDESGPAAYRIGPSGRRVRAAADPGPGCP